jgi:predicted CxxxxCH...CXXCH cytochrome family protein
VPPDYGAHAAHVRLAPGDEPVYGEEWITEERDPTGALNAYSFGCGTCHPKNPAKHGDGVVDIELKAEAGFPPSTTGLKIRNGAGAAFDYGAKTCSGVYCHSTGQDTPTFSTTPGWTSGSSLDCGGCHGNPPAYANGGPGPTANGHIFLNGARREAGHFASVPGLNINGVPTLHVSRHGKPTNAFPTADEHGSPITCQACHFETVDPSNVGPGGLFYLDTSITTQLPGGASSRLTDPAWKDTQCVTCHKAGGTGPVGAGGKVRPLRHVNGVRDVTFDKRTDADLPAGYFASLGAAAPKYPYFMTGATFPNLTTVLNADAAWTPAAPVTATERATLSFSLTSAAMTRDATTREVTCSSVACHVGAGKVMKWGETLPATTQCKACHN